LITGAEKIARFIEMFGFIFLAGGLLGIYIEFKTPGFGLPGLTGMVLLAIFFWGHHIVGLSGSFELLVFLAGIVLLALEIFVIPGFGVAGISGLLLIVLALFLSMVQHIPGGNWFHLPAMQVEEALQNLGIGLGISAVLGMVAAHFLPKTSGFQHLMLSASLDSDKGVSASEQHDDLLGRTGTALTPLHPSGFARIDGSRINVVARGAYIAKGASVKVAEIHGSRIVVDENRNRQDSTE
jgi:membrane-bound serine protease (ClpP class)